MSYIDIVPIVQKYAKQYGIKVVSPILAQFICESANGKSTLWTKHYNGFGMKCGSSWKGASVNMRTNEEYTPGTLTSIRDNFRSYPDADSGIKGYFDFISAKRYANLKNATTPQQYLEYIKADGYATSSTYVQTNMNIIKKYNLEQYDNGSPVPAHIQSRRVLRRGSEGSDVIIAQKILVGLGFDIGRTGVDGKFGQNTERAVKEFQLAHNLEPDGKIGPLTWRELEG